VEFIVLPTFAYEHKVFVGPFSRRFPKAKARAGGGGCPRMAAAPLTGEALCLQLRERTAQPFQPSQSPSNPLKRFPPPRQVYTAPFQWSFPLNLPPQFFGIFPAGEVTGGAEMPWSDEIDHKLFLPPSIGGREGGGRGRVLLKALLAPGVGAVRATRGPAEAALRAREAGMAGAGASQSLACCADGHRIHLLASSAGVGDYVRFSEVAFFHKASRTLMVTDAVVYVPDEAPEVISTKVGGGGWVGSVRLGWEHGAGIGDVELLQEAGLAWKLWPGLEATLGSTVTLCLTPPPAHFPHPAGAALQRARRPAAALHCRRQVQGGGRGHRARRRAGGHT
jgi:hypothetical protein